MMALKKLFAVALALALPAAALAQAAAPAAPAPAPAAAPAAAPAPMAQVYGTLNVNMQYVGAEGATASADNVKPRLGLGLDSSNIGVRGMVEVAHGLKVVYQCETAANIDNDGVSGICNRNSRAGLQGSWGTLFYGNWDTPYKAGTYGTNADDPFGNTDVFGHANIMASPGYAVRSSATGAGAPTAAFDQRAGNSVAYWSPKFAGVSFKLQGSLDEFGNKTGSVRPWLVSGVLNYDTGGLSLALQFDRRDDYFGLRTIGNAATEAATTKDAAVRLAAGYTFGLGEGSSLNIIGWVEALAYTQDQAAAGFKSYGRTAYLVGAKYKLGDHEARIRYSVAMNPTIKAADGTTLAAGAEDELGAMNLVIGYGYNLAKSTQIYYYYSLIKNDDRARYTFGVGGVAALSGTTGTPAVPNTGLGSDPSAFGLGIRHAF